MDDDYEQAGGSCHFCNGPMPCYCPDPLTPEQRDAATKHDDDARSRADLPHVDD